MDTAAIKERVHELYWNEYTNCTKSMLICLGELFEAEIDQQVFQSTVGMLSTSGFGLQCGLVSGGLMFIGIYCAKLGKNKSVILSYCNNFVETFNQKFGSLKCFELRSKLNNMKDPRHVCEKLTGDVVTYTQYFIRKEIK